jgi:hypothetical protein
MESDMNRNDLDPNSLEPKLSDPVPRSDGDTRLTKIGLFAVVALVVMGGLYFLASGNSATTASNTAPGVTTGSSGASPPGR